jgi:anti-repressor protein
MNDIQIFKNPSFGQVRTVTVKGKIHFVAIDIAKALGYKNTRDAILKHCRWVAKCDVPHPQSKNKTIEVNAIPEGDIYRLVANSELPGAEKFESWIFDEVLPQINHTGGYIPSSENDSEEDIMAKALLIAHRKIELKNKTIAEKERQLEEQKPKVVFADSVAVARTSILVGDLAKLIKQNGHDIGAKRLFTWMRENGYLIKRKGTDYNTPTQKSMKLKLLETKETTINHSDGHISISRTPKVTGKGQIYFINKFKDLFNKEEVI